MTGMTSANDRTAGIVRAHVLCPGRILLGLRRLPREQWSTFGGRAEPGESPEEALRREIREELDIEVEEFRRLPDRATTWDGQPTRVAVFAVTAWQGEPRNAARHEHSTIAWFTTEEVKALPMHERARSEALDLLADTT